MKVSNVPSEKHEFILLQIGYDLWEFKAKETNSEQHKQIKRIQKNASVLLTNLQSLSWEVSSDLHDELEHQFRLCELQDDDENQDAFENIKMDDTYFKFDKALESNADKFTLRSIYDDDREDAFNSVPIHGAANALGYLSKLVLACQSLCERKRDSKDKLLYPTLQLRWEMIGKEFGFEVTQSNSVKFISACTDKDFETTKRQYQRLEVRTYKSQEEGARKVCELESLIFERYLDDWEKLFGMPRFIESECIRNVHWILVDCYQTRNSDYPIFKDYLHYISDAGIGDIIEIYK